MRAIPALSLLLFLVTMACATTQQEDWAKVVDPKDAWADSYEPLIASDGELGELEFARTVPGEGSRISRMRLRAGERSNPSLALLGNRGVDRRPQISLTEKRPFDSPPPDQPSDLQEGSPEVVAEEGTRLELQEVASLRVRALPSVASAALETASGLAAENKERRAYEMPRTEVVPIQDSKTQRKYELYVKLPEKYSQETQLRYPVIYTTDAVWHFEMLSGATEYLMPDVILVGISWQKDFDDERQFVSRFRDYTVVKSGKAKIPTGEAARHLAFIRSDVIEYVESRYRADPGERTYFGYSLGGAFGAYVLFAQPDTFHHYILGSPAFNERSLKYIEELEAEMAPRQRELSANVFVSIGELESSELETIRAFVSVLRRRSETGLALTGLEVIEDSDHAAAFPSTVIRGVRWLAQLKGDRQKGHQ